MRLNYCLKTMGLAIVLTGLFSACGEKENWDEKGIGAFSVGPDKQVAFAHGNVQYNASSNSWRFAEQQYDIIGSANMNISSTYDGWIDLFGWGTGCNPTLVSEDGDYDVFVDWGKNNIGKSDNHPDMWRTLSEDEWMYLLYERADSFDKLASGNVNGKGGVIILPDKWKLPDGCKFNAEFASDGTPNNSYTTAQWKKMEEAGAVFLPAAGFRMGTEVRGTKIYGCYWTSTLDESGDAYFVGFDKNHLNAMGLNVCHVGCSVRLVQDR